MIPQVDVEKLPEGAASDAVNCDVSSGSIRPLRVQRLLTQNVERVPLSEILPHFPTPATPVQESWVNKAASAIHLMVKTSYNCLAQTVMGYNDTSVYPPDTTPGGKIVVESDPEWSANLLTNGDAETPSVPNWEPEAGSWWVPRIPPSYDIQPRTGSRLFVCNSTDVNYPVLRQTIDLTSHAAAIDAGAATARFSCWATSGAPNDDPFRISLAFLDAGGVELDRESTAWTSTATAAWTHPSIEATPPVGTRSMVCRLEGQKVKPPHVHCYFDDASATFNDGTGWSAELLSNPGAEATEGLSTVPGWSPDVRTASWTTEATTHSGGAPHGGSLMFQHCNAQAGEFDGGMTQDVDLSAYADDIDEQTSTMKAKFDAWFTSWQPKRFDQARITMAWLDDGGAELGRQEGAWTTTEPHSWQLLSLRATPPPKSRTARVRLECRRPNTNWGLWVYFDDVSFVVGIGAKAATEKDDEYSYVHPPLAVGEWSHPNEELMTSFRIETNYQHDVTLYKDVNGGPAREATFYGRSSGTTGVVPLEWEGDVYGTLRVTSSPSAGTFTTVQTRGGTNPVTLGGFSLPGCTFTFTIQLASETIASFKFKVSYVDSEDREGPVSEGSEIVKHKISRVLKLRLTRVFEGAWAQAPGTDNEFEHALEANETVGLVYRRQGNDLIALTEGTAGSLAAGEYAVVDGALRVWAESESQAMATETLHVGIGSKQRVYVSGVDGQSYSLLAEQDVSPFYKIPDLVITQPVEAPLSGNAPEQVSGTASGGSSTTLVDSSASWTADQWSGCQARIVGGTGAGQTGLVTTNTEDTLSVIAWLPDFVAPDSSSEYVIDEFYSHSLMTPARFGISFSESENEDGRGLLRVSEIDRLHCWPDENAFQVPAIMRLAQAGASTLVFCINGVRVASGISPQSLTEVSQSNTMALVSRNAVAGLEDGVVWASEGGLGHSSGGAVKNLTADVMSQRQWQDFLDLTEGDYQRLLLNVDERAAYMEVLSADGSSLVDALRVELGAPVEKRLTRFTLDALTGLDGEDPEWSWTSKHFRFEQPAIMDWIHVVAEGELTLTLWRDGTALESMALDGETEVEVEDKTPGSVWRVTAQGTGILKELRLYERRFVDVVDGEVSLTASDTPFWKGLYLRLPEPGRFSALLLSAQNELSAVPVVLSSVENGAVDVSAAVDGVTLLPRLAASSLWRVDVSAPTPHVSSLTLVARRPRMLESSLVALGTGLAIPDWLRTRYHLPQGRPVVSGRLKVSSHPMSETTMRVYHNLSSTPVDVVFLSEQETTVSLPAGVTWVELDFQGRDDTVAESYLFVREIVPVESTGLALRPADGVESWFNKYLEFANEGGFVAGRVVASAYPVGLSLQSQAAAGGGTPVVVSVSSERPFRLSTGNAHQWRLALTPPGQVYEVQLVGRRCWDFDGRLLRITRDTHPFSFLGMEVRRARGASWFGAARVVARSYPVTLLLKSLDGALLWSGSVENARGFRLPRLARRREWIVEVEDDGGDLVEEVSLATSLGALGAGGTGEEITE